MAHYALLDENNFVLQVITGRDEGELGVDWEDFYSQETDFLAKRTSYNTYSGVHLLGKNPFRKNYAAIGFRYDESLDAFIPLQPFGSWILDTETATWQPPIPKPEGNFKWDESVTNWVEIPASDQ